MKTCIVTGGAGFIGSHLVDRLILENYKVVVIDNLSTGNKKNINPKAKFYNIDIKSSKVKEIFKKEKPDILFHYAAQIDVRKSVDDPKRDADINILGSLNLLENCREYGIKKIIFASTGGAIYGDADIIPTSESYPAHSVSPYGITKLSVEHYLYYYYKVYNIPFTALRFSNVYGPRQNPKAEAGVIAIFIDSLLSGKKPVIFGTGRQTRDYIYVQDVIAANMLALRKGIGIFNIGTGIEITVNEVLKEIKQAIGSNVIGVKGPERLGEQQRSSLDCSKIKRELGWKYKYDFSKGIQETINRF